MNHFETKLRRQMLDEVSKGGSLAEEVISSIRTVFAFGNQQRLVAKYDVANAKVQKMGIKTAIGHSAGLGAFCFAFL
jgi:ATP-binding cassette subfamily B (MDR/TAP) protein 1